MSHHSYNYHDPSQQDSSSSGSGHQTAQQQQESQQQPQPQSQQQQAYYYTPQQQAAAASHQQQQYRYYDQSGYNANSYSQVYMNPQQHGYYAQMKQEKNSGVSSQPDDSQTQQTTTDPTNNANNTPTAPASSNHTPTPSVSNAAGSNGNVAATAATASLQYPYWGVGRSVITPAPTKPKITTTYWEDENTVCYQVEAKGIAVSRREDSNFINGTKLLNVTGMTRGRRDGILKTEKTRYVVKIGAMNLKGVWIPFERAYELARNEGIADLLHPLFVRDIKSYFIGLSNGATTLNAATYNGGVYQYPNGQISSTPSDHHQQQSAENNDSGSQQAITQTNNNTTTNETSNNPTSAQTTPVVTNTDTQLAQNYAYYGQYYQSQAYAYPQYGMYYQYPPQQQVQHQTQQQSETKKEGTK